MLNKYLIPFLLSLLTLLLPAKQAMLTAFCLITLDMVLGVCAAYKQGITITSKGLKVTVLKVLLYESAIVISFFVQQYLTGDEIPVMKWITSLIGLVELKSILEKLDIFSGGSFFKSVTDKIQGYLKIDNNDQ